MMDQGCLGDCSDLLQKFKQKCHALFPLAKVFQDQTDAINEPSTFNHLNDSMLAKEGQMSNGPIREKFHDGADDIME